MSFKSRKCSHIVLSLKVAFEGREKVDAELAVAVAALVVAFAGLVVKIIDVAGRR